MTAIASTRGLLIGTCWLASLGTVWAGSTVNGDFTKVTSGGDPVGVGGAGFGWAASGTDAGGGTATPLISVETEGGNHFARFESGQVGGTTPAPVVSSLQQTFNVSVNDELRFDFSFEVGSDDSGTSPELDPAKPTPAGILLDAFVVSLGVGVEVYELLTVDRDGVMINPFSTAPADIEAVDALSADFDFGFKLDLAALLLQDVTLFFDMISVDDGSLLTVDLDNVSISATGGGSSGGSAGDPVPEPGTLGLLGLGLLGCILHGCILHGCSRRIRGKAA